MKEFWRTAIGHLTSTLQAAQRRASGWRIGRFAETERKVPNRRRLVVDRPATLEQRYELVDREELADEVFKRLQRHIYGALATREREGDGGSRAKTIFREAGRLAPGRPYFYLKPQDRPGWLVERSGMGWVVSQAEKIVDRDLFLRRGEPVDSVSLYVATDRPAFPRVRSPLFGTDLLAFAVYEQRLLERLGIS